MPERVSQNPLEATTFPETPTLPSKLRQIKETLENPKVVLGANVLLILISGYGSFDNYQKANILYALSWGANASIWGFLAILRFKDLKSKHPW